MAAILQAASEGLGIRYHVLVHRCDITHPPSRFLFLQNYSPDWVETYARLGLHRHGPAQRVANLPPGCFAWANISSLVPLTSRERGALGDCHAFGMGEGFIFSSAQGRALPHEALCAARAGDVFGDFRPPLSATARNAAGPDPPETESVALVDQGKSY